MTSTYCHDVLVTAPRRRVDLRLVAAVTAATAFAVAYAAYVVTEARGPTLEGDVALHGIGLVLAVVASAGGWGAVRGSAWGLALEVQAAKGSLFLLVAALAIAASDQWAGSGARAGDPLVILSALSAFQAAALMLALHACVTRAGRAGAAGSST